MSAEGVADISADLCLLQLLNGRLRSRNNGAELAEELNSAGGVVLACEEQLALACDVAHSLRSEQHEQKWVQYSLKRIERLDQPRLAAVAEHRVSVIQVVQHIEEPVPRAEDLSSTRVSRANLPKQSETLHGLYLLLELVAGEVEGDVVHHRLTKRATVEAKQQLHHTGLHPGHRLVQQHPQLRDSVLAKRRLRE